MPRRLPKTPLARENLGTWGFLVCLRGCSGWEKVVFVVLLGLMWGFLGAFFFWEGCWGVCEVVMGVLKRGFSGYAATCFQGVWWCFPAIQGSGLVFWGVVGSLSVWVLALLPTAWDFAQSGNLHQKCFHAPFSAQIVF